MKGDRSHINGGRNQAFSLIELLVVIAIIGVLASIAMPSMRGLFGTDKVESAATQLSDDLAYARQKAINDRTTVYVVFVSPTIIKANWNTLTPEERHQLQSIINGQYTAYSVFARRSLGDQPGPGRSRYMTEWQRLPEGMFISTNEYAYYEKANWRTLQAKDRPFLYMPVPFPTAQSAEVLLPCIAFNYQGQLIHQVQSNNPGDEYIYISQGAVTYPKDATGKLKLADANVVEKPKTNWMRNPYVRVDWLTGRSRVEHRKVL
jgi:prepilin-type N-terminal cleavage/methylation domain-containing protein